MKPDPTDGDTASGSRYGLAPLAALILGLSFIGDVQAVDGRDDVRADVQAILQMADYVGVEYPEFVVAGRILDEAEYAEQVEFASLIRDRLGRLPGNPAQPALTALARRLQRAVAKRADGERVVALTAELRQKILNHYPVALVPKAPPDLAQGQRIYKQQCAGCHGVNGRGDGPAAAGMQPPPTDFHDRGRQDRRSLLGLFNTITVGVGGTAMPAFRHLDTAERWALAFHIGQLGYTPAEREAGERIWHERPTARRALPDLQVLTRSSTDALHDTLGADTRPVMAYLRSHPQAAASTGADRHLAHAAELIAQSLAAYRHGGTHEAQRLALSAYLDGFELAEPALKVADGALMRRIEAMMQIYRGLLAKQASIAEVGEQAQRIETALEEAATYLQGDRMSAWSSFVASFVILGREGLEAILVLAAIFAFLRRSGRREALPYVHAGWVLALLAGAGTWLLAIRFIEISGAGRETTEGIVALTAAGLLLYVGLWLHNRSYAQRWQRFVSDKLQRANAGRSLFALTALAFLTVYREAFETILFYQALWMQANHGGLALGLLAAAGALAVASWGIFRLGVRLPLRQFFTASAALIVVLAVVFTGKGVAALQEAGKLPVDPVAFVQLPLFGIHPNLEGLLLQGLVLAAVVAGFAYNHLTRPRVEIS